MEEIKKTIEEEQEKKVEELDENNLEDVAGGSRSVDPRAEIKERRKKLKYVYY